MYLYLEKGIDFSRNTLTFYPRTTTTTLYSLLYKLKYSINMEKN